MGGTGRGGGIHIRAATPDDDPAVLGLLEASMGWIPDDLAARFFVWKHREGPFGPSPSWVAVDRDTGRIVGLRTFLRWRFAGVEAVRAVDTATHPDFQGRGIFSRLTLHALNDLRTMGVAFVFNTPNERSRPGYLKMGWQTVGRLPVAVRPRSPLALARLARARAPADKWSLPTTAGDEPGALLAAFGAGAPRTANRTDGGLGTDRTGAYLQWRYGLPELRYRVLTAPDGPEHGLVVFRLRRRGAATEAAVCEMLVPDGRRRSSTTRGLLRTVVRASRADHAVLVGPARLALGLLPVPRQGPTLLWRAVATDDAHPPPLDRWDLSLGDVELF